MKRPFIFIDLVQGSQEWLLFRKDKMTASMAPVVENVSPYQTPLQLWQEIVEDIPRQDNDAMRKGREMEELIRQKVNEKLGTNFRPAVVQSIAYPWLMASLDGYDEINGECVSLEIKYANAEDHAEAQQGRIPVKYYPQVQTQMLTLEAKRSYYASYSAKTGEVEIIEQFYSEKYGPELRDRLKAFWDSIIDLRRPEATDRDWIPISDVEDIRAAQEAVMLQKEIKERSMRLEGIRDWFKERYTQDRLIAGDVKLQRIGRQGGYDVQAILKDYGISEKEAEKYRRKDVLSLKISSSKDDL